MGYVSFREGKLSKVGRLIHAEGFEMRNPEGLTVLSRKSF